jgi:DNA-binding GntR family transcriptional regulator
MTEREQHVAEMIRERIEQGEWQPRRRIPSQSELAEQFNVSLHVIARATADFRERGYLWTLPHKGSYARPPEDWRKVPE